MHLTNHKFKMKNCRKEYCWITEQTINGVRKYVVKCIRRAHLRKVFKDVKKKNNFGFLKGSWTQDFNLVTSHLMSHPEPVPLFTLFHPSLDFSLVFSFPFPCAGYVHLYLPCLLSLMVDTSPPHFTEHITLQNHLLFPPCNKKRATGRKPIKTTCLERCGLSSGFLERKRENKIVPCSSRTVANSICWQSFVVFCFFDLLSKLIS